MGTEMSWFDPDYVVHESLWWSIIHIDCDRYGGCYSGAPFTAWRGYKPSDVDAGDIDCQQFWETKPLPLHGRGNTPQEAYEDLMRHIRRDVFIQLVIVAENYAHPDVYLLTDSEEFKKWKS